MDTYSVYIHTNTINQKKYIGLTKQVPEHRWGANGVNYKSNPHFWSAIQKFGWDMFSHEIVASELSKDKACKLEQKLIRELKTQSNKYGYNILAGGTAPQLTQEVRSKIAFALRGNLNGKGKTCSAEKAIKISAAQIGKSFSLEHRHKISVAKKGRSHSSPSLETRMKISNSHTKTKVYCAETNTVYPSIQQCSRELGIEATNICAVCRGKHKVTRGYHFSYYQKL